MIQSIRLQNWRSHKDSSLEFQKGTNVLVGVMGSGKTSLVDALCFGLFGTFPALQNRRVSLDETIMNKPVVCDSATVRLSFSYNNKNFVVERTIFRGSKASEAKLYCENRLIAGPKPGEVTERIEKELEVDFGLFSRATYSEQNQLDFFLRLSPRERKQKFDELLEINRYETARQNAVNVSNRLKKNTEDQKKWVAEQEHRFRPEDLEKIKKQILEKKRLRAEAEKKAVLLAEKNRELESEIQRVEENEKKARQLREKEVKAATRAEELEKSIASAQKSIGNKSSQQWQEMASALRATEENGLRERKAIEQKKENAENRLNECRKAEGILEEKIFSLEKNRADISRLRGSCPVCKRELKEHEKKQLGEEIAEQQEKCRLEQAEKRIASKKLESEARELKKGLEEKTKALEHAREIRLHAEFVLKQAVEIESWTVLLEQEKQALRQLQGEKTGAVFDEPRLLNARREFLNGKSQETRALEEAKSAKEVIQALEQQTSQLEAIQEQLSSLRVETARLEKIVEKLGVFTVSLQSVQSLLRERLLESINAAMETIWKKAYPYSDFESCQIMVEEGDYEVKVRNSRNEWVRVEGNLSGGERSTAALCIRMAFSLVLTRNLGWLILDEPTHNLDSKAVEELGNLLKNQLPGLVNQVFIITHDSHLENAATATLYEIMRDKNSDGISIPVPKPV